MALPSISAVVATYRRRQRLPRVVDALLRDPDLTELVIVVDGCPDGSFDYLRGRAREDHRIVPLWQENQGASVAQEAGARQASSDVLLMFDDDQIAEPGLAGGHARHHEDDRGLVVVGYVPPPAPGPDAWWHESGYAYWYEDACRRFEQGAPVLPELWGGNLSMRRDDLLHVGWSNPRFPHRYHYDMDFGLRCLEAGMRGVYDAALAARHEYERSFDDYARESFQRGAAMRCLRELHPGATSIQTDVLGENMPRWRRALSRRPRSRAALVRGGTAAAKLAHRWRARPVERRFGGLVSEVESYRGALAEDARLRRAAS